LFNEEVDYDKMGNITSLKRNGSSVYDYDPTPIDHLTLYYNGNQLQTVSESVVGIYGFVGQSITSTPYAYNKNGALQHDANTGISLIEYNSLNLPEKISFYKGDVNFYTYDAMGQKRRVKHFTARSGIVVPIGSTNNNYSSTTQHELTTDYLAGGSIIYEGSNLKMIRTEECYLKRSGSGYIHYSYIKDHLGNNRAVVRSDGWGGWNQYQEMSYFPFGMPHYFSDYSAELQNFKFGDKELDEMHGLKWYDHHARFFGSVIPVTPTPDPHAESYYRMSPYIQWANNPIRYVDPDGREVRVAQEYQEQFRNDLQNVFGDRTSMFSFNDNGTLQLDGKAKDFTKGMTKDQKETFKGLNKAMGDKQVTSVVYADNYNVTVGNEMKSVDVVQEFGGGLYSKTDNLIVVAPSVGSVDVTLDQIQITANGLGFPTQNVQQNTTSTLFHEIGERNTTNINFRGAVIDFENSARRVIGLPVRPYDLNHSKTIRTNYTK
jgi:hypothetical protein